MMNRVETKTKPCGVNIKKQENVTCYLIILISVGRVLSVWRINVVSEATCKPYFCGIIQLQKEIQTAR